MIEQFQRFGRHPRSHLGWTIGSALETVADDSNFDDLAALILDPTYGRSRQTIMFA